VCVDDYVDRTFRSLGDESLRDRQSGTPIGEADLDHYASVLGEQEITECVAVALGYGYPIEVPVGPDVSWPCSASERRVLRTVSRSVDSAGMLASIRSKPPVAHEQTDLCEDQRDAPGPSQPKAVRCTFPSRDRRHRLRGPSARSHSDL
jgi:hypothetical protein